MGTRSFLPAYGRRLIFGERAPGPNSLASAVGWIAAFLAFFAVILGVAGRWAAFQDATWGGIGGELLGYLPIVMLFGPPVAILCLLWFWMRR
jgi:hypothetical protein